MTKKPAKKLPKSEVVAIAKRQDAASVARVGVQLLVEGLKTTADALSKEMPVDVLADLFNTIDKVAKTAIEAQREAARQTLLDVVKEVKEVTIEGAPGKFRIARTDPTSTAPEAGYMRNLVKEKGLEDTAIFTMVVSHELDMAKVDALVRSGKLTQEEVDKGKKRLAPRLVVEKL